MLSRVVGEFADQLNRMTRSTTFAVPAMTWVRLLSCAALVICFVGDTIKAAGQLYAPQYPAAALGP